MKVNIELNDRGNILIYPIMDSKFRGWDSSAFHVENPEQVVGALKGLQPLLTRIFEESKNRDDLDNRMLSIVSHLDDMISECDFED